MAVAYTTHNRMLTVALSGDIDHHRVKGLVQDLEREIDEVLPRQLIVDCAGITFMDSSGIAVLLRLWQRMEELAGTIQVTGLPDQPARVLRAAGLQRLHSPERSATSMRTIKYTNQVSLVFPSRSANESFARSAAAAFAAQLDPTLDELGDVKTAVSEAVTNAIVHAYPDSLGKVELKLRLYPGNELELIIRDWGIGIADVEQARAPLFTTGNEERSGMGFTIMESFMDSVKVRSHPGKGTTVTMRKRFAIRAGGSV